MEVLVKASNKAVNRTPSAPVTFDVIYLKACVLSNFIFVLCVIFMFGCNSNEGEPKIEVKPKAIVTLEHASTLIKKFSDLPVRNYSTYDFGRAKNNNAISIVVPVDDAILTVYEIREQLGPGLVCFAGTARWLGDEVHEGQEVVVVNGNDQFTILKTARTDAVNYDKSTENIIEKIKKYHEQHGIDIYHAETDTIGFRLNKIPVNVNAFAEDLYEFCPDIIDQGWGTIDKLVGDIKANSRVYLWWD